MNVMQSERFYLIENDLGYLCERCGKAHRYLTTCCLERPFTQRQLFVLLEKRMTEDQGLVHGAQLRAQETELLTTRPGTYVPITEREAKRLLVRIALKGG